MTNWFRANLVASCTLVLTLQIQAQDKVMTILTDELHREFKQLQAADQRLYYMSYRIDDLYTYTFRTSFGALTSIDSTRIRVFTPTVRVGNFQLDNTHSNAGHVATTLNMVDDKDLLTLGIWKQTDLAYKNAAQVYEQILTNKKVKVAEEDTAADFSSSKKEIYYDAPLNFSKLKPNILKITADLKAYSKVLKSNPDLMNGTATLEFKITRKYFVDSEGSSIIQNSTGTWQSIQGTTKANDGMDLPLYKMYFAQEPNALPGRDSILKDVALMSSKLTALKKSPIADPFVGPAILSGRAAGVFFHEIFGHRLEGKRMKSENDGHTFKNKIGSAVLPSFLSITLDPTVNKLNISNLSGSYRFDDEGVAAQKVQVVQEGTLQHFLMTRTPINGVTGSNGHARTAPGGIPESRQSNLIVTGSAPKTDAELKEMLRAEAKKQGHDYGYYFEDVQGGFTNVGRTAPNAFNVMPIEVYKVFVDGRPDELVRGVDLIGTPLSMFRRIVATSNHSETFNGMCGSTSGWVPVSASAPSIFVDVIETQKKNKSNDRLPILPRPDLDTTKTLN